MAITDIKQYTHLTQEDIEQLGRELDAIRTDIEESRGERDARYVRRTIQLQRGLAAGGRIALFASKNKIAWVAGTAHARGGEDRREHGARAQHHSWPMGLDERPRDSLDGMGVGQYLPERAVEALAQLYPPQVHQHRRHGR